MKLNICAYRSVIEPSEPYHELLPCKREAVYCNEPTIRDKSGRPMKRSSVECSPLVCPLFTPQKENNLNGFT
jgi:hypothetical protein